MIRMLFLGLALVLLTHCVSEENTPNIFVHALLSKSLDENTAMLNLAYFGNPVGSFTVKEIWVDDIKIQDEKKNGKASLGCGGIVISSHVVDYKNNKISLDKDEKSFVLLTKWEGDRADQFRLAYTLPKAFAIESMSNSISKTIPLKISFKEPVATNDWDECSLELLRDGEISYNQVHFFSQFKKPTLSIKDVSVSFEQMQKEKGVALPSSLRARIHCTKTIRGPEKETTQGSMKNRSENVLEYKLRSALLSIAISN